MTISLFKRPSYLIMNRLPYSFTPGYGLHGKVIFGSSDGLPTVRCHYLNRCSQLAISDFVWRMATNIYRQTSSISLTKLKNLNVSRLVVQLSSPIPLKPVVTSITCRRCSNNIWMVNKFIAYYSVAYIRGLTVQMDVCINVLFQYIINTNPIYQCMLRG